MMSSTEACICAVIPYCYARVKLIQQVSPNIHTVGIKLKDSNKNLKAHQKNQNLGEQNMLKVIKNILPPWPRKMPNQCQASQKLEVI